MMNEYKIYVYGSCHYLGRLKNDDAVGNGGYGIVITLNDAIIEMASGGFSNTTNARMDIIGITEGLKRIKEPSRVTVYSASGYVIGTLTKGWLESWKKTGFKNKKHADLWMVLDKMLQENIHVISFQHAKDIKFSKNFQLAEDIAKEVSSQNDLPNDLLENSGEIELFNTIKDSRVDTSGIEQSKPILDSVCVDASTIDNPGVTEYRGVDTRTGRIIFSHKYEEATNNIGEFLAIVHALALYKKQGKELKVVYSDSLNAISWVQQKMCKTKYQRTHKNNKLFDDIERAVNWLNNNTYETKVLKWDTVAWGEIPADYGRK
jgi:ribonuclease HI